jgi:UDP-glucose 4-epimerase
MAKHNCHNFVFSSSATVYGTPEVIPIPESSPLQPESAYGRTKAMVEQILQDVCRASAVKSNKEGGEALKAVSVRYFK